MRRWSGISTDTSKGRLLWIKGYFHNRRRRADTILASPLAPLPLDSKALGSKSVIFATSARGSCGVDLGPVPLRIVTFSVSSMGDWLYGVRWRVIHSQSLMFSTFAMLHFQVLAVRGGGTDRILMRPRKGLTGATSVFEGSAPSSA